MRDKSQTTALPTFLWGKWKLIHIKTLPCTSLAVFTVVLNRKLSKGPSAGDGWTRCATCTPRTATQRLQRNSWSTERPAQVTREWRWVRKANVTRLSTIGLCVPSTGDSRLAAPRSYKGGGRREVDVPVKRAPGGILEVVQMLGLSTYVSIPVMMSCRLQDIYH